MLDARPLLKSGLESQMSGGMGNWFERDTTAQEWEIPDP